MGLKINSIKTSKTQKEKRKKNFNLKWDQAEVDITNTQKIRHVILMVAAHRQHMLLVPGIALVK